MSMQQVAQMNAAQLHARSTPTPPPQRGYEPQFYAQQNQAGSHVSVRPAYESGFVIPQGYDPNQLQQQLQTPTGFKTNPGYDRPLYENGGLAPAPYEQPYIKNRRESAMFMGNLSHQGSKSRLRDESQF
jgi:RalA-binding protein 1